MSGRGAPMIRTIIESPFGKKIDGTTASPDEIARNIHYAKRALLDSLRRGEAPFGSHLLYPQVLADARPEERRLRIDAGFSWGAAAEVVAIYEDYGITPGMREGLERAKKAGQTVSFRLIGKNDDAQNRETLPDVA